MSYQASKHNRDKWLELIKPGLEKGQGGMKAKWWQWWWRKGRKKRKLLKGRSKHMLIIHDYPLLTLLVKMGYTETWFSNRLTRQQCKPVQQKIRSDHLKWLQNWNRETQGHLRITCSSSLTCCLAAIKRQTWPRGIIYRGMEDKFIEIILTLHKDSTETSLSQRLSNRQRNPRQWEKMSQKAS